MERQAKPLPKGRLNWTPDDDYWGIEVSKDLSSDGLIYVQARKICVDPDTQNLRALGPDDVAFLVIAKEQWLAAYSAVRDGENAGKPNVGEWGDDDTWGILLDDELHGRIGSNGFLRARAKEIKPAEKGVLNVLRRDKIAATIARGHWLGYFRSDMRDLEPVRAFLHWEGGPGMRYFQTPPPPGSEHLEE